MDPMVYILTYCPLNWFRLSYGLSACGFIFTLLHMDSASTSSSPGSCVCILVALVLLLAFVGLVIFKIKLPCAFYPYICIWFCTHKGPRLLTVMISLPWETRLYERVLQCMLPLSYWLWSNIAHQIVQISHNLAGIIHNYRFQPTTWCLDIWMSRTSFTWQLSTLRLHSTTSAV